jgi:hypothetical protein
MGIAYRVYPARRINAPLVDCEWIWRGMIGDWQDEWDLKRRGSDRSVNRHDICRVAAYLNKANPADAKSRAPD